ncbi:hypothetical protein, partial [Pseudobutyrivibrio sp.]
LSHCPKCLVLGIYRISYCLPAAYGRKLRAKVGGQAVLGRQDLITTPWLTERHGYDPTYFLTVLNALFWGFTG